MPAPVDLDRGRARQLLQNLLDNAVKFSPEGGEIRVRVWVESAMTHLTVTDPGIGIPPQDLALIFDRFQRGSNVDDRRFAGMGLGLYLCRQIVEQNGGRISAMDDDVTNADSRALAPATTFHVVLPSAREPASQPPGAREGTAAAAL